MLTDVEIYVSCMDQVRGHLDKIQSIFERKITTGDKNLDAEIIYLRLRKVLESIAFASLSANREKYSVARAGFATEWNARRMLGFIEKVNPDFYPVPFRLAPPEAPGIPHIALVTEDYLTQEKFIDLYDEAALVLHSPNPFATSTRALIDLKQEVPKWLLHIRRLLTWHFVTLVDSKAGWIIHVPEKGEIAFVASSRNDEEE